MADVGSRVVTFPDWKREMLSLADRALGEGRLVNAAFAFRAAELYTMSDDPDKEGLYDRFLEAFYQAFGRDDIARHLVPYEEGFLPAIGHAIDYMKSMNVVFRGIHLWFMKHMRQWMEQMAEKKFRGEGQGAWVVDHLKYITKREKALNALDFYLDLNDRNMHPERVTQDVLILSGRKDHFIPLKMHKMQIQALSGARSVTGRVFTEAEHAGNHCQTGNIGLALGVMIEWLREKS